MSTRRVLDLLVTSNVTSAVRGFFNLGSAASKAESKMGKLGGTAVRAGGLATAGIVGFGVASVKAFVDFDKAMVGALAIMGDISGPMRKKMEAAAKSVATVTTFSATEAAGAYYGLASAGLNAEQSMQALPIVAKFAQAGLMDLQAATDYLTAAQSGLGLKMADPIENMREMEHVASVLTKANNIAQGSVEDFAEALSHKAAAALKYTNKPIEEGVAALTAFAEQGIKGSRAGEDLARILRDLPRAATTNTDEFAKFGIEIFKADGSLKHMADVVKEFEDALGPMNTEQKAAVFHQLGLTRGVGENIKNLMGFSEVIRDNDKTLQGWKGSLDEVSNKQLTSISAKLEIAKNKMINWMIDIGEPIAFWLVDEALPWLEQNGPRIVDDLTAAFEKAKPWLETLGRALGNEKVQAGLVYWAAAMIATKAAEPALKTMSALTAAFKAIGAAAGGIKAATTMFQSIGALSSLSFVPVGLALQTFIEDFFAVFDGDWSFDGVIAAIEDMQHQGIKKFKETLESWKDTGIAGWWDETFGSIPSFNWDGFTQWAEQMAVEGPEKFKHIGAMILNGLWDGVKAAAGWLWDRIIEWKDDFIQKWKDAFGIHSPSEVMKPIGQAIIDGVAEGARAVWTGFIDWIMGLPGQIITGFGDTTMTLFQSGINLVQGMANGATSMMPNFGSVFQTGFTNVQNIAAGGWGFLQTQASNAWGFINNTGMGAWNWMRDNVFSPIIGFVQGPVVGAFITMRDGISGAWQGVKDAAAGAWNSILGAVRGPINTIIDFVNTLISGINAVLDKIPGLGGIDIPSIPGLGASTGNTTGDGSARKVGAMARGGLVPFVTNGPSAIVGEGNPLHPEFVIPTDPKYRDRAMALYEQLGGKLLASGGTLGGLGDAFSTGVGWAKDKAAGFFGSILRKGLETLFSPVNELVKSGIAKHQPGPMHMGDAAQGIRQAVWDWVRGADSTLPTEPPYDMSRGMGLGSVAGGGPGPGGTYEPLASPLAKLLSMVPGLYIISGWRSSAAQAVLYQKYLNGTGNLAAPPGRSNHERGLAADLGGNLGLAHKLAPGLGLHFPVRGENWHVQAKGYRDGLKRVPYDDMPARLHKDERVLTAREAREYEKKTPVIHIENMHVGRPSDAREAAAELEWRARTWRVG